MTRDSIGLLSLLGLLANLPLCLPAEPSPPPAAPAATGEVDLTFPERSTQAGSPNDGEWCTGWASFQLDPGPAVPRHD